MLKLAIQQSERKFPRATRVVSPADNDVAFLGVGKGQSISLELRLNPNFEDRNQFS